MSAAQDIIEAQVAAGAAALGLTLSDESRTAVIANLASLRAMAETLETITLEPGADPLPIFRP